jgi:uncharacterized protein involved in type VI secretion and phage assembly
MALPAPPDDGGPRFQGVYPGIVTNIVDEQHLGRVEVKFPWITADGERDVRTWARLCSPYADNNQGLQVMPAVDSEVIVAFGAGQFEWAYIVGSVWNGKEKTPATPEQANNIRLIRTRADSRLEFDDTDGAAKVSITMRTGHKVVLDEAAQTITIRHGMGCVITLDAVDINVNANIALNVTAPMVNVDAALSTFSGIVECDTLMADAFVLSPGYSPGVGNLL